MKELKVSEMFYSLQGEGTRSGQPTIFIRLQGCSVKHACYKSGIRCDTEFESGTTTNAEELLKKAHELKSSNNEARWITWTGGEPADQLDAETLKFFSDEGFCQTIETSGAKFIDGLDYVRLLSISPKVSELVLAKNYSNYFASTLVHPDIEHPKLELRYVRNLSQAIPVASLERFASYLYISPHWEGGYLDARCLDHCIQLCLKNPRWSLSIQQHKIWNVL